MFSHAFFGYTPIIIGFSDTFRYLSCIYFLKAKRCDNKVESEKENPVVAVAVAVLKQSNTWAYMSFWTKWLE